MSPRAAWRLESLRFNQVYDYAAGKLDWIGAGLSVEGRKEGEAFIMDFIRRDVFTCSLRDRLREVTSKAAGVGQIPVVNAATVVLGVIKAEESNADVIEAVVEDVMDPAPTTLRPTMDISEAASFMNRKELSEILITTSEGKLVGILDRQMADHAVDELRAARAKRASE